MQRMKTKAQKLKEAAQDRLMSLMMGAEVTPFDDEPEGMQKAMLKEVARVEKLFSNPPATFILKGKTNGTK